MTKRFIRIFGGIVIIALAVVVVATTHAQTSQERLSQYSSGMPEVTASAVAPPCSTGLFPPERGSSLPTWAPSKAVDM